MLDKSDQPSSSGVSTGTATRSAVGVDGRTSPNEYARLRAIQRYDILDSPPEGAFDRIAALAASCLDTPIATVNFVDQDRIWFKACHGVAVEELDRELGLCASAILDESPYVVLDASVDPRCRSNSLVAGEFGLRFYAAAPIVTSDGYRLGTLNVMDRRPRQVTPKEIETLQVLAAIVADELEVRLAAHRLLELQTQLSLLGEAFQLSALPTKFPVVAGLDLGAWYRPAGESLLIGGDFYDALELGHGSWALVVGDVCGKGANAAVVMGSVLHQIRALAAADRLPSQLLRDLNRSLIKEGSTEKLCTVCYMLLEPGPGYLDLTVCCAGHPLPLVRRANGIVENACTEGTLLGAFDHPNLTDTKIRLDAGDSLLAYTDGVIEQQRDAALGETRLRAALSNCPDVGALACLSYLEKQTQTTAEPKDDRAMVLVRVLAPANT